ncbi:MAG: hypothetical protein H0T68_05305 [Gemmatimonadales bacterium]|nr:hypothetical protein [Gemmatimonadales bacterium]
MSGRRAGVALAIVHVALIGLLGLKLLADRAALPRGWARTLPYDPSLPIRGRYVRLRLEVPLDSLSGDGAVRRGLDVRLEAGEGRLRGVTDGEGGGRAVTLDSAEGAPRAVLVQPVAFFIPEHIPDPSVRPAGEELWAEVTIPRRGPPRPIRLGIRKGGALTPLDIR